MRKEPETLVAALHDLRVAGQGFVDALLDTRFGRTASKVVEALDTWLKELL